MSRINKCIDLLANGRTVFALHPSEPPPLTYDSGREFADVWADMLVIEFEHYEFNVSGLAEFMRGLRDADLRLPMSEGYRSLSMRLFNWYRPQLVACPDRQVGARLGQVTQFLRPMSSPLAPQIVSRVLVASTSRRIKAIRRKSASPGVAPIPPDAE